MIRYRQAACLPAILALILISTAFADAAPDSPHAAITGGCTEVGGGFVISRVECTNPDFEPLLWGSPRSTGGDKHGLQGTLPAIAFAGHHGKGRVMVWTGHEGFWGSGADRKVDNDRFRCNALRWLLGDGGRVAMATGHGEMLNTVKFSSTIRDMLKPEGVGFADIPEPLSGQILQFTDLLIVGNTWEDFPEAEAAAVARWVEDGGALLVIGLGWAYYQYNDDPTGDAYALNILGKHFGWRARGGTIKDPASPNGKPGKPSFPIKPLADYAPGEVVVLHAATDDLSVIPQLAADNPHGIYVAVGKYMGLQFPADAWAGLADPAAAVALMDTVYKVQCELVGWNNQPYGGEVVWYISKDDPEGKYYMHSGNPIVMKLRAGRDMAKKLNDTGRCGWGAAHELGHDMVISACGNLFVHQGTAEEWCNVFTTWTFDQLGWTERVGSFDDGHEYHAQADPDFSELTGSSWVLLGCLELIWSQYGWEGMHVFLSKAALDTKNGVKTKGNAEKTAYFVENLSSAYGLDFAELIAHWGFPVSDASREFTAQFPQPEIAIPGR
jgi:hypothetical protein